MAVLTTVEAPELTVFRRGKVRDTFDLGDGTLLMVATDRISAFDVVLPTPIPDKGRVLTQMSRWWFARTTTFVPNHLRDDAPATLPSGVDWPAWEERSMRTAKADRIDVECVVRGYLAGSGWKEYRSEGTLAGEALPAGLLESAQLGEFRFTPAIKNDNGHDENISKDRLADIVGAALAAQLEAVSLLLFDNASQRCRRRGMILVDTKFEFGFVDGELTLIDEVLTPDSSRFWNAEDWAPGRAMPSFDKQPVRDYLETLDWDKSAPGPELPEAVVSGTRQRYLDAAARICALELT